MPKENSKTIMWYIMEVPLHLTALLPGTIKLQKKLTNILCYEQIQEVS